MSMFYHFYHFYFQTTILKYSLYTVLILQQQIWCINYTYRFPIFCWIQFCQIRRTCHIFTWHSYDNHSNRGRMAYEYPEPCLINTDRTTSIKWWYFSWINQPKMHPDPLNTSWNQWTLPQGITAGAEFGNLTLKLLAKK